MPGIAEAKILMIATDGFEDSELLDTRQRLLDAGADVTLASLEKKEIKGDKGGTITPDISVEEMRAGDYDGLVLPGGVANPDKLRMNAKVVETVRAFDDADKPIAAICHGPWLLAEADVVEGRTVTSWPSIRTDLRNAGAEVVDREAVTDANLVTSRKPEDIPAFVEAFVALVEKIGAEEMA
jgi:protease I